MKVLSLFSGIGAFEKALQNLEIPVEMIGFSEIDKYAVKSYCAIHNIEESMNLGDITKVDEKELPKDIDLITYGFPCQDISLAGKQKGLFNEDGSQTRSGLFFEALRIIEETKPKVAIAENVKNLTSKKFNAQFQVVLASLEAAGYNNYWKVLNAKDYGVPQNRERVFIVSIREDIDTGAFKFPEAFSLEKRLKDVLEDEVDEKYYLSAKMKEYLSTISVENKARGNGNVYKPVDIEGISKTITTKEGSRVKDNFIEEPTIDMVGMLDMKGNEQVRRVYGTDGLSPTLNTMQGGHRQPKILVREATKQGYAEAFEGDSINLEQPNSKTRRGRVGHGVAQTITTSPLQAVIEPTLTSTSGNEKIITDDTNPKIIKVCQLDSSYDQSGRVYSTEGISPTLMGNSHGKTSGGYIGTNILEKLDNLRIRKLTPKECYRLMGFDDADFEKAEEVNSNTQLYKQAGNSIVVPVVEHIFNML